uniref:Uncharacterized protein n=1 Tax=Oncorhynchus tshawytscha TaxID=74940 RepID=A0A8C8JC96_ONCTS
IGLSDEVAHLEKFVRVKEEHRFLLKSLLQYQSVSEGEMLIAASTSSHPPMTFSSSPTWASEPCLYQTTCRLDTFLCPKVSDRGSRKLVQLIALDSSGRPVFPIVLGGLTVYSLGDVCVCRPWPGSTQPVGGQRLGQL